MKINEYQEFIYHISNRFHYSKPRAAILYSDILAVKNYNQEFYYRLKGADSVYNEEQMLRAINLLAFT